MQAFIKSKQVEHLIDLVNGGQFFCAGGGDGSWSAPVVSPCASTLASWLYRGHHERLAMSME